MKPQVELSDKEKSEVIKVYRKYDKKQDKWYKSDTPKAGYNIISYQATKARIAMFYKTKERAQEDADKYDKHLKAYKRGRTQNFPDVIDWYMFTGTELHSKWQWSHESGAWLNSHGFLDSVRTDDLLNDMDFVYGDHTTNDMFDVMFFIPRYYNYYYKEVDGEYKIFQRM